MRVLIIDNYDSFTYNLYQYVGELLSGRSGHPAFDIRVKRNDEIGLEQAVDYKADRIIVSPGPGTPGDKDYFGVCAELITTLGPRIPLLGVCLGMQGIAHCFGGNVVRAETPMHGKTSLVAHDGAGIYRGLPQSLEVMRYHSLVVETRSLPSCLRVTSVVMEPDETTLPINALLDRGSEIMGVRHREYPIEGIQYHPESFATEGGKKLLANFLFS